MAWFDCATKKPIQVNFGGQMQQNLGLFLHHAVANGSLFTFFNNPASQVSAHWWVSRTGTIEQYVDSNTVAWHAKQANGTYTGVETEGCTSPPYAEPMTDAMMEALSRLYAEGHERHGWPLVLCNEFGKPGFGYHRLAVQTACPCDVRVNARQPILDLIGVPPVPVIIPQGEVMSVEIITQNGKEYMVTNVVAGGRLVQVRQDMTSIGQPSTAQNTSIIDLSAQWPDQLKSVTSA